MSHRSILVFPDDTVKMIIDAILEGKDLASDKNVCLFGP
jgi:hypothetical protein